MAEAAVTAEVMGLRRMVEAQQKALAHWRREADADAGKIARYEAALRGIGQLPAKMPGAIQVAIRTAKEAVGE